MTSTSPSPSVANHEYRVQESTLSGLVLYAVSKLWQSIQKAGSCVFSCSSSQKAPFVIQVKRGAIQPTARLHDRQGKFHQAYAIKSVRGLGTGACGSVEVMRIVHRTERSKLKVAVKTARAPIFWNPSSMPEDIKEALHVKSSPFGKLTAREQRKLYAASKGKYNPDIASLPDLEQSLSEAQTTQLRKRVFSSQQGARERFPDLHLKAAYAFGDIALEKVETGDGRGFGEEELRQEALMYQMWEGESHPNILQAITYGNKTKGDNQGSFLVLEYAPNGDLEHYLEQNPSIPLIQVVDFGIQLLQGISFLAEKKVLHRDLKLENLLLDKDFNIKICDFGLATSLRRIHGSPGNPYSIPPEYDSCANDGYSDRYDCWAAGFILLKLLLGAEKGKEICSTQNLIFSFISDYHESNWSVEAGEQLRLAIRLAINELLPKEQEDGFKEFVHIIYELLDPDPSNRIAASEAAELLSLQKAALLCAKV